MSKQNSSKRIGSRVSRRDMLRLTGGCAALSSTSVMSTILNLQATNAVLADDVNVTDYKSLVCVFLYGGNDSFNMLIPRNLNRYNEYAATRGDLAIPRDQLLPIVDGNGLAFGIHPGMPEVRTLYNQQKLAFVANVGSLVEPIADNSTNEYGGKPLPLGLFSHSDLQRHWMTSIPESRSAITGWAGRMADCLETGGTSPNSTISMNISLAGVNMLQTGTSVVPYVIRPSGASVMAGYGGNGQFNQFMTNVTDDILSQTYSDLMKRSFAKTSKDAIDAAVTYNDAIAIRNQQNPILSPFTASNPLSAQLKRVAETINARGRLGQRRQTFFVALGGWDHHDDTLASQAAMLPMVSQALKEFYDATNELNIQNRVTTFTASDFGRTLSSNGNGSDHAWGGNHIVMGGAVRGKEIWGTYPSLVLDNSLDVGRGRLIPTTSVDAYNAELALWYGMPDDNNLEHVVPNIRNFHTAGGPPPVGFVA